MPTNDPTTFGLYLRGLLAIGARPFAHRGSVYRLLGRPAPQGTAVRFLPPLPPVGFVYEHLDRFEQRLGSAPPSMFSSGREPDEVGRAFEQEEDASSRYRPTPPATDHTRPGVENTAAPPPIPPHSAPSLAVPPPSLVRMGREMGEAEPSTLASPVTSRIEEPAGSPWSTVPPVGPGILEAPRIATLRDGIRPASAPLVEQPSAVNDEREAAPESYEKRVGLAIPGLTQRRSAFAALASALPPPDAVEEEPPPARPDRQAPEDSTDGWRAASRTGTGTPTPLSALRTAGGREILSTPTPDSGSPSPDEAAMFRARTRIVEEVEQVRRAVAQSSRRVTPETVREVVREVVQEAVRGERLDSRSEGSPARRGAPAPASVVVVRQASGDAQRMPRAFWSSSALRSAHLRMLR